jgi:hypothetical protein
MPKSLMIGGNNLITIDGNDIMHTIVMNTNLDSNTKWLKVLFGYDFVNGVIDEEEDFFGGQTRLFISKLSPYRNWEFWWHFSKV